MKIAFQQYSLFKQSFHLKEYLCLVGFFLKIFGYAVAIRDENRKIHYVRKQDLRNLGAKYDLPLLNKTILLEQIKRREEDGIRWNPLALEKCKLSSSERQQIEAVVAPLMKGPVIDREIKKDKVQLPVTVMVAQERFFMKLGKKRAGIAGKGGQRLIKFAYDLKKGRMVVRKCIKERERQAMVCFQGIHGIAKAEAVFDGRVLLEKYYAGTLKDLVQPKRLLTAAEIVQGAKDLLSTLSAMHQRKTVDGRPAFHSDIKLANLFYRRSKKRGIEMVIGDLGSANCDQSISGTKNWFSPEYTRELLRWKKEKNFDQQFNQKYGQAYDLWAIGLVIASLLIHDGEGRLVCLRKGSPFDQVAIDQEIAKRMSREADPSLKQLWTVVQKLVRVNPFERIQAHQACQMLEQH